MSYSISKITACLDFSEYSFNALNTAAMIAGKFKATLYILHSAETLLERIGLNQPSSVNKGKQASHVLTALASDIESKFQIRTEIIEDDSLAIESIVRHVIDCKIDLIVIGSNGASGYRKGYLGSTAYNVVKFAICPVLIISGNKPSSDFKKPLFPVRPILTAMRHYNILHHFLHEDALLEIFGYMPGDGLNEDDMRELEAQIEAKLGLDKLNAAIKWSERNAIPQYILNHAEKIKADLIILTPVIDASIKPFFIGPNMHHILNNARVPLLVISRIHKNSAVT